MAEQQSRPLQLSDLSEEDRAEVEAKLKEQSEVVSPLDRMRQMGAAALRVGGPWAGQAIGGALGFGAGLETGPGAIATGAGGAMAGRALGGAAGEALAELVEPGGIEKGFSALSAPRIAVGGVMGGLPEGAFIAAGKPLNSAIRSTATQSLGVLGNKWASGEHQNPFNMTKEDVQHLTDWNKWDVGSVGVGALTGLGLGSISARPNTPKPTGPASPEGMQEAIKKAKGGLQISGPEHQALYDQIEKEVGKARNFEASPTAKAIGIDPKVANPNPTEYNRLENEAYAQFGKESPQFPGPAREKLLQKSDNQTIDRLNKDLKKQKVEAAKAGRVPTTPTVRESVTSDGTTVSTKLVTPEEAAAAVDKEKTRAVREVERVAKEKDKVWQQEATNLNKRDEYLRKQAEATAKTEANQARLDEVQRLREEQGLTETSVSSRDSVSGKNADGTTSSASISYRKPAPEKGGEGGEAGAGPKTKNGGELFQRQAAGERLSPEVREALEDMKDELEADPLAFESPEVAKKVPMLNRRAPLTHEVNRTAPLARTNSISNNASNKQVRNAIQKLLDSGEPDNHISEGALRVAEKRVQNSREGDINFNPLEIEEQSQGLNGPEEPPTATPVPTEPNPPTPPSSGGASVYQQLEDPTVTPKTRSVEEIKKAAGQSGQALRQGFGQPGEARYIPAEELQANPELQKLVDDWRAMGDPQGKREIWSQIEARRGQGPEFSLTSPETPVEDATLPLEPSSQEGQASPISEGRSPVREAPRASGADIRSGSVEDRARAFLSMVPEGTEVTPEMEAAARQAATSGEAYSRAKQAGTGAAKGSAEHTAAREAGARAQADKKAFDELISGPKQEPKISEPKAAEAEAPMDIEAAASKAGVSSKTLRRALTKGLQVSRGQRNKIGISKESLQNWAKSTGRKLGDESGKVDPLLITRLGTTALGAAAGGAMDTDNPVEGMFYGGLTGALFPTAAQKAGEIFRGESRLRDVAGEAARLGAAGQRFNLLSGTNLVPNTLAPWGSGIMGSLETLAKLDPRGAKGLAELFKPSLFKGAGQAWREAGERIGDAERAEQLIGEAPSRLEQIMAIPGRTMTAGDIAVRDALIRAGFSEDEARRMTLTSEPWSAAGRWVANAGRTTNADGKTSTLIQYALPFKRTATNIVEQGLERIPGIGFLANATKPEALRAGIPQQLAQQGMGAAVFMVAKRFGENMDPSDQESITQYRRFISNLSGQYALIASAGFAAGLDEARGKNPHNTLFEDVVGRPQAVAQSVIGDLPLPTARPIQDVINMAGSLGSGEPPHPDLTGLQQWLPRGAVPGFIKETSGEDEQEVLQRLFGGNPNERLYPAGWDR